MPSWRGHSCLQRRDSSRRSSHQGRGLRCASKHLVLTADYVETSLDAADTSVRATKAGTAALVQFGIMMEDARSGCFQIPPAHPWFVPRSSVCARAGGRLAVDLSQ